MKNLLIIIAIFYFCKLSGQISQDYNDVELEKIFKQYVLKEVQKFEFYTAQVGDKKVDREYKYFVIDSACRMFSNNATIEVSSKFRDEPTPKVPRQYFFDLMKLKYHKVEISYENTSVSDLIPNDNDDGYSITGTFHQRFSSYDENGNIVYEDMTIKDIDIDILKFEDVSGVRYRIVFNNIKVVETQ